MSEEIGFHGGLLDGPPPPQTRTRPAWPGYDTEPTRPRGRLRLFARLRRRPSHATA